ncbi:MAG: hypothetical protein WC865_10690 [Bacteroidales bacterium]
MTTYTINPKVEKKVTDYEADFYQHATELKSEISVSDHRNPELSFDDMKELFQMLELGLDFDELKK